MPGGVMSHRSLAALCVLSGLSLAVVLTGFEPAQAQKPRPGAGAGASRETAKRAVRKPASVRAAADSRSQAGDAPQPIKPRSAAPHGPEDPLAVAARVDELILDEIASGAASAAPLVGDADFLRRVSFDIAGISPSPQDVTLFGLDPDPLKRQRVVDRLLQRPEYAANWARYWRDVIFTRATEARANLARKPFEDWMAAQLAANRPWSEIATSLLTATGDVAENGQTALIFAQSAEPDEVAAETSRIFLGIQLQCANCHDHPTDSWKREQFHSLAAFFPRVQMRRRQEEMRVTFEIASLNVGPGGRGGRGDFQNLQQNPERIIRLLDRNGDNQVSREEAAQRPNNNGRSFERLFDIGDVDKNGQLTADEIRKIPPPPMMSGRGSAEYYMPDLNDPKSQGTKFDPAFFLTGGKPGSGLSDLARREALARYLTSPENPWFARALVNRLWAQLVGEGFYMPIDDIGPERTARHPQALQELSSGFVASGYDLQWLVRAIANTQAYQRQMHPRDPQQPAAAFASVTPVRLRADALFDALTRVLGFDDFGGAGPRPRGPGMGRFGDFSPRGQFNQIFAVDPSVPPDEINGTLPQALLMMNSSLVNRQLRATGGTTLARLLERFPTDDDALRELYLLVHAREPSDSELTICHEYLKQASTRGEAFEDILWSLVNSTEFQVKR